MKSLRLAVFGLLFASYAHAGMRYLGDLSNNPYDPNSVSNPYGAGSRYNANSVTNPYGQYGSQYSNTGVSNPYATNAPKLYAPDGTYLGKLSANRYDPESVSNPYGQYGSRYSATSVNNPSSQYGNPLSNQAPGIYGE